jgi:small subunit ribosomal protein S1
MDPNMSDQNLDKYSQDDDLQRELDEALGSMNIGSLMEADEPITAPATPGVRRGTVISIQKNDIFVDMGGKSQGILPAIQFEDEPLPREGDLIEVTIEGYNNAEGVLILSRKGAVQAASWQKMAEGMVVEGRVTGHNKGGLELDVDGIRAFMPISHIELFRVENLAPYDNQRLKCEVTDVRRDERSIVVSRRAILHREAEEAKQQAFESLQEGQMVSGTVRTIMPYGAFVDIGGVDGLLHVGDMAYTRVNDPKDIVKEGQKIQVKILKIDRDTRKIGLGLKQVMPDPWSTAAERYAPGGLVAGRITRLEGFGAFAELEPGVEGLIPISEMTYERRIGHPREVVKEGDVINLSVLSVDLERRRISLSIKQAGADPWQGASVRWPVDSVVEGTVKRTAEFGAFVELTSGVEGLIHISELSDDRIRRVEDVAKIGDAVRAKVLEVDEERRRMSLSIRALKANPDYTGEETAPAAVPEAPAAPKKRKKPLKGGLEW